MRQQIVIVCLSLIYFGVASSDKHSQTNVPQEAAVAVQAAEEVETYEKGPISCGAYTLQWKHVKTTMKKACLELKPLAAPDQHVSNILGEIHESRRERIPWSKKYYMYPLTQTVADSGGIIAETPYLFITNECVLVAIYLRVGARIKNKSQTPARRDNYKLCWDIRKGKEAVVTDKNGFVDSIYPHSFNQKPHKPADLSILSRKKYARR